MGAPRWHTLKETRAKAGDKGLCTKCGVREVEEGYRQCDFCRESARKAMQGKRRKGIDSRGFDSDGWCPLCQGYGFHRVHVTGNGGADCERLKIIVAAERLGFDIL